MAQSLLPAQEVGHAALLQGYFPRETVCCAHVPLAQAWVVRLVPLHAAEPQVSPSLAATQVPEAQLTQGPLQAVAQQMPLTQFPLWQSEGAEHDEPFVPPCVEHCPLEHVPLQEIPHPPQLAGSFTVSVQVRLQRVGAVLGQQSTLMCPPFAALAGRATRDARPPPAPASIDRSAWRRLAVRPTDLVRLSKRRGSMTLHPPVLAHTSNDAGQTAGDEQLPMK